MLPSERLAALGLSLPDVAAPAGMYVPARVHGGLIFTAGQLPFVNGELIATGLVGSGDGQVSVDIAAECARIAALNALAAAAQAAGGIDAITGIVRVGGFVASGPDFTAHPQVINGASALLGDIFGDAGKHARAAVGVSSLPLGSPVEVELIASVD